MKCPHRILMCAFSIAAGVLIVLLATKPSAGQEFGNPVSISEDWLLVGVSSSVNIYEHHHPEWTFSAELVPGAWIKHAEVDGDWDVLGTPESNGHRGAAWVFHWNGSEWYQASMLESSSDDSSASSGSSVAASGERIVVGAPYEEANGVAYVFEYRDAAWHQSALLVPDETEPVDPFGSVGWSVDVLATRCCCRRRTRRSTQRHVASLALSRDDAADRRIAPTRGVDS